MQRTIGTGRVRYTFIERGEWADALRQLADDLPLGTYELRDVSWHHLDDMLHIAIRWKWWIKDDFRAPLHLGIPNLQVQRRQKHGKRHVSTNYPAGIPIILREGATAIEEQMPQQISLYQHRNTGWWVLTLDDNSGTVSAESDE